MASKVYNSEHNEVACIQQILFSICKQKPILNEHAVYYIGNYNNEHINNHNNNRCNDKWENVKIMWQSIL